VVKRGRSQFSVIGGDYLSVAASPCTTKACRVFFYFAVSEAYITDWHVSSVLLRNYAIGRKLFFDRAVLAALSQFHTPYRSFRRTIEFFAPVTLIVAHNLESEQIHFLTRRNAALSPCNRDLLFNGINSLKVWKQKPAFESTLDNDTVFFYVEFCF